MSVDVLHSTRELMESLRLINSSNSTQIGYKLGAPEEEFNFLLIPLRNAISHINESTLLINLLLIVT